MGGPAACYGKTNTIWKRYDRWCAVGVWECAAKALGDADLSKDNDDAACQELMLDSTSVKAQGMRVDYVIADAAYDSDAIRALIRGMEAKACIKPSPTRKRKKRYGKTRYKHRNVIEQFFRKLK